MTDVDTAENELNSPFDRSLTDHMEQRHHSALLQQLPVAVTQRGLIPAAAVAEDDAQEDAENKELLQCLPSVVENKQKEGMREYTKE